MNRFWSVVLMSVPILGTAAIVWPILDLWPLQGHWLPRNLNEYGGVIDHLFDVILYITGVIFIATGVILAVALWRSDGEKPATYSHGNNKVEIAWAVAPAAILVFISIYQMEAWARQKMEIPTHEVDGVTQPVEPSVRVIARQFDWDFVYPGPDGRFDTLDDVRVVDELHVPLGSPVVVQIESIDVLHSFFVPVMRVKQDVVPGHRQLVWFQPTEAGAFEIMCTELCGWGHYKMKAMLYVHPVTGDGEAGAEPAAEEVGMETYEQWQARAAAEASATSLPDAAYEP